MSRLAAGERPQPAQPRLLNAAPASTCPALPLLRAASELCARVAAWPPPGIAAQSTTQWPWLPRQALPTLSIDLAAACSPRGASPARMRASAIWHGGKQPVAAPDLGSLPVAHQRSQPTAAREARPSEPIVARASDKITRRSSAAGVPLHCSPKLRVVAPKFLSTPLVEADAMAQYSRIGAQGVHWELLPCLAVLLGPHEGPVPSTDRGQGGV